MNIWCKDKGTYGECDLSIRIPTKVNIHFRAESWNGIREVPNYIKTEEQFMAWLNSIAELEEKPELSMDWSDYTYYSDEDLSW